MDKSQINSTYFHKIFNERSPLIPVSQRRAIAPLSSVKSAIALDSFSQRRAIAPLSSVKSAIALDSFSQ
ncbi:MAG: hypothetical protein MUE44_07285 [Oscillatoriaceae cyanobacterium Prado104]|nr:hypothetical protein [Oscillatoriaceae cyanobacterium Prado104]